MTTTIAIHQPNYMPWLGYFHKIAQSDVFIFLDDAQFSKNSYINRVQVLVGGRPKWITVPVSVSLGDAINVVRPACLDWSQRHMEALRNYYRDAPKFGETWDWLNSIFSTMPHDTDLAAINAHLIEGIVGHIGLECQFLSSSSLHVDELTGDDRLLALIQKVTSDAEYLSGRGGASYQNESKFQQAGISLRYSNFNYLEYDQGLPEFSSGLSVIDALFCLGSRETRDLVAQGKVS